MFGIICLDRVTDRLIAFQKLVAKNGCGGGNVPALFALRVCHRAVAAIGQGQYLTLHIQNGLGAGFIPSRLGAYQLAFHKVHPGSSQPWVRTSGPLDVIATVCSK